MLTLKKTIVPLMSAFIASTAMVGFAQADDPCGSDGSGDKPITECPAANAEAAAQAPVDSTKNMVGDLDGDKPLTAEQQVTGDAVNHASTSMDLNGDEPTNQPIIDTTNGNDS
ncbi:hypothetical protein FMN63_27405 [Stappia sp. BW2]|jgi:hypothetical protein|uniref:hypothetical protein n=1 Tax=Stappia sp. BW2 TaxID=2592622 RepID=UPI0011DE6264|nr:hypothetical protein [Stappia sp. BW2]TYC66068.1 hypothetical protein FMN63_27405 [Stappia sp. BW2]